VIGSARAPQVPALRIAAAVLAVAMAWSSAARARAGSALDADEIELRVMIADRRDELEAMLETLVNQNTGTYHRAGLEAQATLLGQQLEQLGFAVTQERGAAVLLPDRGTIETGPLVIARRATRARAASAPRFLLVGHYDTVFEPDSAFQKFARDPAQPQRATGPGVADMKGGLVVLLAALRALADSGAIDQAEWTVLLNGDEELGSLGSRPRIEEEARRASYGFVFESAQGDGAMVRSRSGLGQYHMRVHGVAAHAGSAHAQGRSAIRELATKILAVEALSDDARGITLNVGTMQGGSKRNIVPDLAEAWIDVRYAAAEDGPMLASEVARIAEQSSVPDTRTDLWGSLHRPPKPATPEVDALLEQHAQICAQLGIELAPAVRSGGGTDGSLMGAIGLATLDSMGVVGGASHTEQEFVQLDSLVERASVAALLLRRLIRTAPPQSAD
jgi:glutamate carboxypeptidase